MPSAPVPETSVPQRCVKCRGSPYFALSVGEFAACNGSPACGGGRAACSSQAPQPRVLRRQLQGWRWRSAWRAELGRRRLIEMCLRGHVVCEEFWEVCIDWMTVWPAARRSSTPLPQAPRAVRLIGVRSDSGQNSESRAVTALLSGRLVEVHAFCGACSLPAQSCV